MLIKHSGSVATFVPESDLEYEWLILNADAEPWQWVPLTSEEQWADSAHGFGPKALLADHRMAPILEEAVHQGGWLLAKMAG